MASLTRHNTKNPGVKRILQEAKEIANDPSPDLTAAPLEDDLFQWHFTIKVPHTDFKGGIYHGRILLPAEYPLRPPEVLLLTPNGRFEINKKVCLTITGFHEEFWQPAWGIRTALTGLVGFFETEAKGAIGGLDAPSSERQRLAKLSTEWTCPTCKKKNCDLLPEIPEASTSSVPSQTLPTQAEEAATPVPAANVPSPPLNQSPAQSTPILPEPKDTIVVPPPITNLAPTPTAPITYNLPPRPQPLPAAPYLAPRQPQPTGTVFLRPNQSTTWVTNPRNVAPKMEPSPPTWLDRFIICLLIVTVGLAANGFTF